MPEHLFESIFNYDFIFPEMQMCDNRFQATFFIGDLLEHMH